MKIWSFVLALFLALTSLQADAARFGGGRSVGKQSSNVTQREAAPRPAQQQPGAANAANTPARKPWGAMLGGLAAGLGLAWLANSLGLGDAFGNILLIALVAFAALAAWGWYKRSRANGGAGPASAAHGNQYAYQGATAAPGATYRNDATRPLDVPVRPIQTANPAAGLVGTGAGAMGGSMIGSALRGQQSTWDIPPGFDSDAFVQAAKSNFVTMQSAWDRSDLSELRALMTDEMLGEIRAQLAERDSHAGVGALPNRTEVSTLNAEVLGIEDLGNDYMASVEFNGMIQENDGTGLHAFREVWNMTKPKSGNTGWLVAGVQALQ